MRKESRGQEAEEERERRDEIVSRGLWEAGEDKKVGNLKFNPANWSVSGDHFRFRRVAKLAQRQTSECVHNVGQPQSSPTDSFPVCESLLVLFLSRLFVCLFSLVLKIPNGI